MWKELFHCKYFNVKFSKQVKAAELCGALKVVILCVVVFFIVNKFVYVLTHESLCLYSTCKH